MTTSHLPRFRYVNEAVGLMFLVALVLFIGALLGSGQVREWLHPGVRLKVILPPEGMYGLSKGADVEILGTTAGKVIKIVIDPNQQIYAEAQIQREMTPFIRRDSRAVIRKQFGVAGASYLDISRGSGEPLDWKYAVLEAEVDQVASDTLTAMIEDIRERVRPVIEETQAILVNLSDISGGLARGEGTVGRLLRQEEMADRVSATIVKLDQVLTRINPILDDLQGTTQNVRALSAKLNAQSAGLPEISREVQDILVSLKGILKDVKRTSPEFPVLLQQTQQTMTELEKLLRNMQSSWLFGGSAEGPAPPPGRLPPLEVRP